MDFVGTLVCSLVRSFVTYRFHSVSEFGPFLFCVHLFVATFCVNENILSYVRITVVMLVKGHQFISWSVG